MLQYPLRTGPTEELVWYVAEANALRRVRQEASAAVRAQLIAETRRWVMRDLAGATVPGPERLVDGPDSSRGSRTASPNSSTGSASRRCENWSDEDWEGFTLQALWRVCCDGVRDLPGVHPAAAAGDPPPRPAPRGDRGGHRTRWSTTC